MTSRALHRDCCPKCQGTGHYFEQTGPDMWGCFQCCHEVRTDVTGPTDDELRIAQLEDRNRELETKLSQCAATCEAEARKARDGALVEAAELMRDRLDGCCCRGAGIEADAILALRGRG